jgi:predicted 2-oxoglutarate/Fe(II)-dependent dioxygenase YbiX
MKVNKLEDKIFYFTDLLKDYPDFLDKVESTSDYNLISEWKPWYASNVDIKYGEYKEVVPGFLNQSNNKDSELIVSIITNLISKCINKYTEETHAVPGYLPSTINVRKYDTEAYMGPHIDTEDERDKTKPSISLVFYLNDDYEGGEIEFPNQGISLKPKAGSIIIFPSISPYYHDPKPVIKGTKYLIPVFWYKH